MFLLHWITYKYIKKDERIEQMLLKKFREVSYSVWFSFEAVIIVLTIIRGNERSKNNFDDNYNLV